MDSDKPSLRRTWRFTPRQDGNTNRWLWQLFTANGRLLRRSPEHDTYLAALTDALQKGFKPNIHDYSVDLPHGRVHFPPGQEPEYLLRSQLGQSQPQRPRKREIVQSKVARTSKD
jgi:hypothetical protein